MIAILKKQLPIRLPIVGVATDVLKISRFGISKNAQGDGGGLIKRISINGRDYRKDREFFIEHMDRDVLCGIDFYLSSGHIYSYDIDDNDIINVLLQYLY